MSIREISTLTREEGDLMKAKSALFIILLALVISGTFSFSSDAVLAEEGNEPVAKIGEETITVSDLEAKIEEIPSYARKNFLKKEGKQKILENMIKGKLLYKAAVDAGYMEKPDIKEKIREAQEKILQTEYFKNEVKDNLGVEEERLREYYEEHKDEYSTAARMKAAQILVDSEEKARDILKQLKDGKDFSELAQQESLDLSSARQGGQLGYIKAGGYIRGLGKSEEFEEAAFSLKEGEVSEPVKTSKGWHIIKCIEKEPASQKPFDEVKRDIAGEVMVTDKEIRKAYEENREEYKSRARVKARHIVLSTKEEAEAVRQQLQEGADFEKLAEEKSEDKASASKGGDIGYIYEDGYIRGVGKDKAFEEAAFSLEEGEISEPVETKKGWHIITITQKTPSQYKNFDEVKNQIRDKMLREYKEKSLDRNFENLKEKYNVQVFEENIQDSPDLETMEEEPESRINPLDIPE